jgi:hypothetical protein
VLANAFVLSANGKGKLVVPPASIKPYGVVKLSISPAGKVKKQRCNASAHVTTQKLKVTGTMFFDSHSRGHHSWGQLGSKHKKMTFSGEGFEGYGQMFTTCVATTSPCASSLTWSASNLSGSEQFVGGASGKTHGFIFASSVTDLSKPRNSTRSDSVSVRTPAPKLKRGKGNSATLTVPTAGGTATGGGKLASSQPGTSGQVPCGKSKSQTQLSWTASWKNRKPALLLRAAVFGSFKLNNGSQAVIDLTK